MKPEKSHMPWDCTDTFGKHIYYKDPGQAHLCQWPLKLRQVSSLSPYFYQAHLILASDCSAFSYKSFHSKLLGNRVLLIGCPDSDGPAFMEKLLEILRLNDILSLAVVRMDAPCCKALTDAVMEAIRKSHKDIPVQITTVFTEGEIVV